MEEILHRAERLEKEYEWLGAVESYEKALKLMPEDDFSRKGETWEWLGYAFYRAAFQAENKDEFRRRLHQAIEDYEKAKELYQRLNGLKKTGTVLRSDAMKAYMGYWLASEASEKKKLLNDCWRLTKGALEAFDTAGIGLNYGKTFNQLSVSAILEFTLESDFQARVRTMKEAVGCGEKAIKFLSTSEDASELSRAYAKTVVCLNVFGYYCQDIREREPTYQKSVDYWQKAKELSEEIATLESLYPVFGGQAVFGLEGSDDALSYYRKGLEYAKRTRDKFFIGCALDWLTYHNGWRQVSTEDKDKRTQVVKTTIQYAQDTKDQFAQIFFISPRTDAAWVEAFPVLSDFWSAMEETDVKRKRDLLEKAAERAPDMLKKAENSGYPEAIDFAHMISAGILSLLAGTETNREEKKKLLEHALQHKKEWAANVEQLTPLLYFNRGYVQGDLAQTKSDLAELAEGNEMKKNMLQEAVLARESSLKFLTQEVTFFESKQPSLSSARVRLGSFQFAYGNALYRLYGLTRNRDCLEKAIEAFREAAESFQKHNLRSRMAECFWRMAQAYDAMGEHSTAAQHFSSASNDYRGAAEKIPQLKGFYQDHACYMEAWSEIEKAKNHHKRQEYRLSEEHFQNAAEMHKSLKQWSYLAANYSAWAQVEYAEDLSRKEQCEEAHQAFEQAIGLFEETTKSIQDRLTIVEGADEKQMATQIVNATDFRREYCKARIDIEEAKILDRKGEHHSSFQKYGSAVKILEQSTQKLESELDKKECQFIIYVSRAWQKMEEAEAQEGPQHYEEASQLFEKAKDLGQNEKSKALVLGHSRFCRALGAGARFAETGDMAEHAKAMQQLDSATSFYMKADFQSSSEYAKATRLLFDAYVYMGNAARETDPERKTKLYTVAQKVLQASADSYTKAGNPSKREQALKLLETAKEQGELTASLAEVLHAPIVASTATFTAPAPTSESAAGLERFEHAEVQGNLILSRKELGVGEDVEVEIEVANAGKGQALLNLIEGAVPEGFGLTAKPEPYRVEGSNVNMKGKRLDPLKAEEVKFCLRPKHKGSFTMAPRILYLDENGNAKSHQPEPVTVIVKELGITGWLKGER